MLNSKVEPDVREGVRVEREMYLNRQLRETLSWRFNMVAIHCDMVAVFRKKLRSWSQSSENTANMIAVLRKILRLDHSTHKKLRSW